MLSIDNVIHVGTCTCMYVCQQTWKFMHMYAWLYALWKHKTQQSRVTENLWYSYFWMYYKHTTLNVDQDMMWHCLCLNLVPLHYIEKLSRVPTEATVVPPNNTHTNNVQIHTHNKDILITETQIHKYTAMNISGSVFSYKQYKKIVVCGFTRIMA